MRKFVLVAILYVFFALNLDCAVFADDLNVSNICTKKEFNKQEMKICNDIIKNKVISIENKDKNQQLLVQSVVRKMFDFFSSEWHENKVLDYEKTSFLLLISDKFSDKVNPETGLFETELSNKLFELIRYTNSSTYDTFKKIILDSSVNETNLETAFQMKYLEEIYKLDKNDFEAVFYFIKDKKVEQDILLTQTPGKLYNLIAPIYFEVDRMKEYQKEFALLYFKNKIYPKLKQGEKISEKNFEAFLYFGRLHNLKNENHKYLGLSLINSKYDISPDRMIRIMYNRIYDEKICDEALEFLSREDKFSHITLDKISEVNKQAITHKKYDKDYVFESWQYYQFLHHPLSEEKKIEIIDEVLKSDAKDKYKVAYKKIARAFKKETFFEDTFVDMPKLAGKCFISFDEHISNFFDKRMNKTAFFVGMLNPINFIGTVVISPIAIPLKYGMP